MLECTSISLTDIKIALKSIQIKSVYEQFKKHVRRRGRLLQYTGAVAARHHCPTNKNQLPKVRLRRGVQFNGVSVPDRPKLAGQGLFDPRLAAVQNRGHQIAPGSARETRLLLYRCWAAVYFAAGV